MKHKLTIRNIVEFLDSRGAFRWMSDEMYLQFMFRIKMHNKLNLSNPTTFSEKIQWLKLNDRRPEYTTMVDKYAVKKYVSDIIGEEYIIPTLGVWEKFEDIDFSSLPDQFVLKCTHDSGGLVICRDKSKLDMDATKRKIEKCLKRNYYWMGREWPYKNVPPRIIAEAYMENNQIHDLRNYRFFAFDGVVKALFNSPEHQNSSEKTKFDFFNMDFRPLNYKNYNPDAVVLPKKPDTFNRMRELTEKLSKEISQVRVDFYEVNDRTYFGELTFAHRSGMMPFEPDERDKTFGEWIKLSDDNQGGYLLISNGFVIYIHEMVNELSDYKFYCFNGRPILCQVIKNRTTHETIDYFNMDWQHQEIKGLNTPYKPHFEGRIFAPYNFEWMKNTAALLSKNIPFIRVDFYEIQDKPFFGELTFFPASGIGSFCPDKWNNYLGEMTELAI